MEGGAAAWGFGDVMIVANSLAPTATRRLRLGQYVGPTVVLCVLLFSAFVRDIPLHGSGGALWRDEFVTMFDVQRQSWLCGYVLGYLLLFVIANWSSFPPRRVEFSQFKNFGPLNSLWLANLLLIAMVGCFLIRYILQYTEAASGTDTLVFLVCAMLNQWLIWLIAGRRRDIVDETRKNFMTLFVVFGCVSLLMAMVNPQSNTIFHAQFRYHGSVRWSGIWKNPNIFGLLMSVALIFSIGRIWEAVKKQAFRSSVVWAILAIMTAASVIKSYSRGAWVAAVFGLVFFAWNSLDSKAMREANPVTPSQPLRLKTLVVWGLRGFAVGFILVCVIKIAAGAQVPLVQRSLSAFNERDFSSQNRLASYQDGINMLLDHSWLGYSWDDVIAIHNALYLQSGLSTGEALKLNDFLMFALRFGVPIFAMFLLYLWVWLSAGKNEVRTTQCTDGDILLCRTATLMLAIGFLFTDGLFHLAPGGAFWLFLTLSFDFAATVPGAKNALVQSAG